MIDILCPILGRPPNAMLRSLEFATRMPFLVHLICSPGDKEQIEICRATGHTTYVVPWEPDRADYAKKINWAYERTSAPWVFNGADDIRFSPDWDTEALKIAEETGKAVIGTNDLHNPAVLKHIHATHILFARSYIEEEGGTFDGENPVFSEAYDHQFIDNEFVYAAQRRGQWAFASESHVEHLHPVWGLAEWDATYNKAFRQTNDDTRLYHRRLHAFQRVYRRPVHQ